jgi:hypothetical protein
MSLFSGFKLAFNSLLQLGPSQMGLYSLYQFGLRTEHYQRMLTSSLKKLEKFSSGIPIKLQPCLSDLPDRNVLLNKIGVQVDQLYEEADEIVKGYVRLFGGQSIPLELTLPEPLAYWTKYELKNRMIHDQDIKFIWEPGRFGWAYKLAMAYYLSKNEQYAETFWRYTEQFFSSNPPYQGPHWMSGQEVAIRLVALAFVTLIFTQSEHTTAERQEYIAKIIAIHAERILPTLIYARSQNNNHLITEALGLYTASAMLPDHPFAIKWYRLGWHWLKRAFQQQISTDGTYTQHSTNYHRLMLQAALWAHAVHEHSFKNEPIPKDYSAHLESATHWLWKLVDPQTGRVPNLGHNDGAYILPLTVCPYHDYRPIIYAAARTFLQKSLTPSGPWDDMTTWLCLPVLQSQMETDLNFWHQAPQQQLKTQSPYLLINQKNDSWATLRVGKFTSRPAHADQLHLDLWWRGHNLAHDPGTYLYNASPPWDNSLTNALVHNTVVVDDREFMQHAGRFLYLDWAQARVREYQSYPDGGYESITADHKGYRKIHVTHTRKVTILPDGQWEVIDHLEGPPNSIHTTRLHWLLPDWDYEINGPSNKEDSIDYEIQIKSPDGWVCLKMMAPLKPESMYPQPVQNFQLIRAGKLLVGSGSVLPISGWASPTYGEKIPALACILYITHPLPIEFKSEWIFPCEG